MDRSSSSSFVDTSLDLTIGVTRMRVEEDSTVCFSRTFDPLHLQKSSITHTISEHC